MGFREEWNRRQSNNVIKFKGGKPAIDELEALLNSDDEVDLVILPNGEIRAAAGSQPKTGKLKPLTMREKLGGEYAADAA